MAACSRVADTEPLEVWLNGRAPAFGGKALGTTPALQETTQNKQTEPREYAKLA